MLSILIVRNPMHYPGHNLEARGSSFIFRFLYALENAKNLMGGLTRLVKRATITEKVAPTEVLLW